jgi:AraC-like DNA-binding protein
MFEVVTQCQRFACRLVEADRDEFVRAIVSLANDAPSPDSQDEEHVLRRWLLESAATGGAILHRDYHQFYVPGRCAATISHDADDVLARSDGSPESLLLEWLELFIPALDRTHPLPLAARAARLIRQRYRSPLNLDQLARDAGGSRSALARSFMATFGMTAGAYQRRARVSWAAKELRTEGSDVDAVAVQAGYASRTGLHSALAVSTGLTPAAIRALTNEEFEDLVHRKLSTSIREVIAHNRVRRRTETAHTR